MTGVQTCALPIYMSKLTISISGLQSKLSSATSYSTLSAGSAKNYVGGIYYGEILKIGNIATKLPTINIDGTSKVLTEKANQFVDGQLYSKAKYDGDTFIASFSTKVAGVKFAAGNGTEASPLEISSKEELLILKTTAMQTLMSDSTSTQLFFKLTSNITLVNTENYSITNFKGTFDGNNKILSNLTHENVGFQGYTHLIYHLDLLLNS